MDSVAARCYRGVVREASKKPFERVILVCCSTRDDGKPACANRGSEELRERLKAYVKEKNLKRRCRVVRAMCLDLCALGPNVCVMPDDMWYHEVGPDDLPAIIERHIRPLEEDRRP